MGKDETREEKKVRTYISGGITGKKDYLEKFVAAEEELRKEYGDVEIVNPAYMSKTIDCFSHKKQVEFCFELLKECDVIYLLEGWEESYGAQAEYGYAVAAGIMVVEQSRFLLPRKKGMTFKMRKCEICGKEFTPKAGNAKFCSEECRKQREKFYIENRKPRKREPEIKPKEKVRPSKAFDIEAEARKEGKHYADIQKEQTLKMVGKVEIC